MNTIKQESPWNVIKGNNIFIYITCYTYKTFKTTTRNSYVFFGGEIKTKNKYLFKNWQKKITSVFSNSMFFKN